MSDVAQGTTLSWDTGTPVLIGKITHISVGKPASPIDSSDLDSDEHEYLPGLPDDEISITVIGTAPDIEEADKGDMTITWTDLTTDEFTDVLCTQKTKSGGVAGRIETTLTFKLGLA